MQELESSSPEETERIGAALAGGLRPGDVVAVEGELGVGKTTLIRGACRALGVTAPITSPTYTVGHRYRGRVHVSHLDLYRFEGLDDEEWGNLEPYFEDAVVFVEWAERAGDYLDGFRVRVRLQLVEGEHRLVQLEAEGKSLEIGAS
jgi:tRNA threonylcarbamoyladenosine biosynthesis protein TsaE